MYAVLRIRIRIKLEVKIRIRIRIKGWKKPGFLKKKPAQWVFWGFLGFFFGFFGRIQTLNYNYSY